MAVTHLGLRAAVCLALALAVSAVVSLDEPFSNTTSNVFSLYPQLGLNGGPCALRPPLLSRSWHARNGVGGRTGAPPPLSPRFSPANQRYWPVCL
jgi:hypothetical protein